MNIYTSIEQAIILRLAKRMDVRPSYGDPEFAYTADVKLDDNDDLPHGHPTQLVVDARTPQDAIHGLVDMIQAWLTNPRAAHLESKTNYMRTRATGLVPVQTEPASVQ